MNVIFLTMSRFESIADRGLYTDLLRMFHDKGDSVYVVSPRERHERGETELVEVDGAHILGVRTLNLQKTNIVEKGVGQVLIEGQYIRAIRRYLPGIQFDLIIYSTPPITFSKVICFLKRNNPRARTYLLLKDIFPQNAVDLGMMSKTGGRALLYRLFRNKERRLYALSDFIGCMSPANVRYLLEHNPEIAPARVEVAPNSLELIAPRAVNKEVVRGRYGIPNELPVFIYGGNLGRPQGIDFLIRCLDSNASREDAHFLIIGSGTEFPKLKQWHETRHPASVTVMGGLPKTDYDELVRACDVGLIFLDHRFTIPNYPSRLLSYLENKMPVLCATDPNTDIGPIAEKNGYGYWCESNSVDAFNELVDKILGSDIRQMGERGYEFFTQNYLVGNTYNAIMSHMHV